MTKTFRDLGVDDRLCDALDAQGIVTPFPIQELTLPLALDGHDLIGQARTGTGKTLAFGLPLLQRVDTTKRATQALVVVPTRELCVQVHEDLQIGGVLGVRTISVYGGVPYEAQIEALTTGVHVVVGTPGRLIDHLNRGNLRLADVRTLVLDEADEMLDMGFLPDVERLIEACPEQRHTMLFSATMPTAIVKLARRYLNHPTFTRADTEAHETAPNVEQHFFSVHRMDKPRVLARILQTPDRGGAFVFVRTKHMADRLVEELGTLGTAAIAIHGDLRQTTRERNLDRFRAGKADVLVATEVAARGLDVSGVSHVFNYDCPDDEKMYLHRIGRTARAGAKGVAVTFAEFNEADRLNVIRKAVGATDDEVEAVFSTSELLTQRFGLPAERPWDRFATSPPRSSRERSGDSADRDRRRGRTDGRPKSTPGTSAEGRRRRPRAEATVSRAEPTEAAAQPTEAAAKATEAAAKPTEAAAKPTEAAAKPTEASPESAVSAEASGGTSSRTPEPGARTRTRTRARARGSRDPSSRPERTEPERRAPTEAATDAPTEASDAPDTSPDAPPDEAPRPPRRRGSTPAPEPAAAPDPARSSPQASRTREPEPADPPTPGQLARGEGRPQLARRVRIDHLP